MKFNRDKYLMRLSNMNSNILMLGNLNLLFILVVNF